MKDPEKELRAGSGIGGRRPGAGRPLGSPNRLTRPLKELAALQSEACIAVLVELRDHADTEQVRLAAANALLDRAHGKPRQAVDLRDDGKLTVIVNRRGSTVDVPPALTGYAITETESPDAL